MEFKKDYNLNDFSIYTENYMINMCVVNFFTGHAHGKDRCPELDIFYISYDESQL